MSLHTRILLGLVLGAVAGVGVNSLVPPNSAAGQVVDWTIRYLFQPIGQIFLNLLILTVIPLVFTSSTFVPVASFPGWLQAFAKVNPITITVDALRALCLGGPTATHVWQALAWIGGLLVLTIPAAIMRFRRVTAR